jgi:hypothetical protein
LVIYLVIPFVLKKGLEGRFLWRGVIKKIDLRRGGKDGIVKYGIALAFTPLP